MHGQFVILGNPVAACIMHGELKLRPGMALFGKEFGQIENLNRTPHSSHVVGCKLTRIWVHERLEPKNDHEQNYQQEGPR